MKLLLLALISTFITYFLSCKDAVHDGSADSIIISPIYVGENLASIPEISGITLLNDSTLLAINDGGSPPELFKISKQNPSKYKSFPISNKTNIDWEAITQDDNNIYIGEFGNNSGTRKDLQVLAINKQQLEADSLAAKTIHFDYSEQTNFTLRNQHDFDCEAMISFGEDLFLFTKHRGNSFSHLYRLPKSSDSISIEKLDLFDVGGQITAASLSSDKTVLALLGYNWSFGSGFDSFLWIMHDFAGNDFFGGKSIRLDFDIGRQYESMTFSGLNELLISNEYSTGQNSTKLYKINIYEYIK